jgi:hypothetical protein
MSTSPEQRALRAASRKALGKALREFWQHEQNEPLPERLTELLGRINRTPPNTSDNQELDRA